MVLYLESPSLPLSRRGVMALGDSTSRRTRLLVIHNPETSVTVPLQLWNDEQMHSYTTALEVTSPPPSSARTPDTVHLSSRSGHAHTAWEIVNQHWS